MTTPSEGPADARSTLLGTELPSGADPGSVDERKGELPVAGRVVEGRRTVRIADVGADRRARLDTLARYLNDVAEDDAAGATLPTHIGWVLRRTRMDIDQFPVLGEDLVLRTYCSATASRWAERTTIVRGAEGAELTAVAIWVAVDAATGVPTRPGDRFFAVYGPSAGGRQASARLALGAPDRRSRERARPWPLRRSDVDAWGHVHNAVAWAAVEDAVDIHPSDAAVALVEHHAPIDARMEPVLVRGRDGDEWSVWLLEGGDGGRVLVASAITVRPRSAPVVRG